MKTMNSHLPRNGGGRPYMLIASLYEATHLINNLGIENIENHIMRVKKYLHKKLSSEGYAIYGLSDDQRHCRA